MQAQKESPSYDDLLLTVLEAEVKSREEKQLLQRMKAARLPLSHDLDKYDFSNPNGLTPTQLNQLRELHWVEEGYNLMLAGPLNRFRLALGHCFVALGCSVFGQPGVFPFPLLHLLGYQVCRYAFQLLTKAKAVLPLPVAFYQLYYGLLFVVVQGGHA